MAGRTSDGFLPKRTAFSPNRGMHLQSRVHDRRTSLATKGTRSLARHCPTNNMHHPSLRFGNGQGRPIPLYDNWPHRMVPVQPERSTIVQEHSTSDRVHINVREGLPSQETPSNERRGTMQAAEERAFPALPHMRVWASPSSGPGHGYGTPYTDAHPTPPEISKSPRDSRTVRHTSESYTSCRLRPGSL